MSSLPSEILTLIFNRLHKTDLLQCQHISKHWHRNSLDRVYSDVVLHSEEAGRLFIRTISNSPQLGQLPHLKVLPPPGPYNEEPYVDTVLSFKNSLTSLRISGDDSLAVYRTLCDQLDQFKSLQRLTFVIRSYTGLTHFEDLVDKCPHLKELNFKVYINAIQRTNEPEPEPMILPRPDIHKLECDWKLICTESQLEYVMHKFTNIQRLSVYANGPEEPEVSGPTLIKFIQYVISTPVFTLEIFVRNEDLLDIFIEFMKTKNGCKNVNIGYAMYCPPSFVLCGLYLSAKTGASLSFVPDTVMSFIGGIQISFASSILTNHRESKHPSLKKLSILGVEPSKSLRFLNSLSLNLPNLREFSLGFSYYDSNTGPIVINMPHSSLDSLTWHVVASDVEVYIKLKTESGLRYYYWNRLVVLSVDESCYLFVTQNVRFDINCKYLKELGIVVNYNGDHYCCIF
ncbi:hypothetical protein EDC94DRAFT_583396 [Helicostylum pulchrum]|nr:hypothetical protein EDC94DRAFT_583396 [Helicostylum pulchrum]